ncbi:unnamed protein product [Didymodactylos carnosus]|uniref:Mediator of RNA polymerase II transcription subunit 11 n=1 Tax=Didymodactylos carnosus TaxID=1234261 RepID=A0A814HBR1_9BILA|nr:unnamed protein product [Didymodactylos carnosus]CAF1584560.1 unnamed protein product [Didymodactylos carnosus]CAF3778198.1 unnamed protein product [Didymodactylos carnosus]CAF4385288.1 unnamed protein product [Didymodactylos carnosus]
MTTDFTEATAEALQQLKNTEDKITTLLWLSASIVDNLSQEHIIKEDLEHIVKQFCEDTQKVQNSLLSSLLSLERISSGLPHEDSCYGSWLDFCLASMRTDTIRNKLLQLKNNPDLQKSKERVKELERQLANL